MKKELTFREIFIKESYEEILVKLEKEKQDILKTYKELYGELPPGYTEDSIK